MIRRAEMAGERERREHILAVAERLLRHYGPQKTTIAEIAKAAEVGVGTVYLEFPSKEAIVEELSRLRHVAVLEAMEHAARASGRFSERVKAVFDARLRAFQRLEREGAHARDLVHCMNPAVKSAAARFREAEVSLIATLLSEGHEAGELALLEGAERTARAVLQAYAMFSPPYVFGCTNDVERELSAMHSLVLQGLCIRTPPKKRR